MSIKLYKNEVKLNKIKIKSEDGFTRIWVDEKELIGVKSIELEKLDINHEVPVIKIKMLSLDVDIESDNMTKLFIENDEFKNSIINKTKKLCEKFINKVETGRARSKETYKECKELLEEINKR